MESRDPNVVCITGAGGLIGNQLARTAALWVPGWKLHALTRQDLNLADGKAVAAFFRDRRADLVIHCAALSKSPACDANRELAFRTNVEATRRLVESVGGAAFIFFSTDLIFDGRKGDYTEADAPNPLMYYGETKARAEEIVRAHPQHLIVRISLTGGTSPTGDRGFNEEMKKAWREGKTLNLFTDEFRSPMGAEVTARAVWELAKAGARGTFHLCSPEKLSRLEIGRLLAEKHPELQPRIKAGTRKDYQGPERPADTSLDTAKIQRHLPFALPRFADWIRADTTGF